MKSDNNTAFAQYVADMVAQNKGKRIHRFAYQNQFFWLKQPDHLKGIWHLLKPAPAKALHKEIEQLRALTAQGAPVAHLAAAGDDFLALEDAGRSANLWIEDETLSQEAKLNILKDCAKALTELHQKGFIHGRPALRDMTWQAGKVTFIDFEEHVDNNNLPWQKVRDCLIFIHSLFRSGRITEAQDRAVIDCLARHCEPEIWRRLLEAVRRYRWVYYLLLPFKPIAKMDLIAVYKVFENLLPQFRREPE